MSKHKAGYKSVWQVENYSTVWVLWLSRPFGNSLRSVVAPDTRTNDRAQSSERQRVGDATFKGDAVSGEEQNGHVGWRSQRFPLPFSPFEKGVSAIARVLLEEPRPPKGAWGGVCPRVRCRGNRRNRRGPWPGPALAPGWWCEVGLLVWGGRSVSVLPSWTLRKVSAVSVLGTLYWVWCGEYLYLLPQRWWKT